MRDRGKKKAPFVSLFKDNPNSRSRNGMARKSLKAFPCLAEPQLDVGDPMLIFWKFRFRENWVIDADGTRYYCWLALVSAVAIYNIIAVPMRSVFDELDDSYYSDAFLVFDYVGDFINVVDLVVSMFIGYLGEELVLVHEPRLLANHWFDTSGKLDLLSVVPTDLAYIWTGMHYPFPAVRFNRLLKYPKLTNFLKRTEGRVSNPQNMRLFALMMKFFILIHLNACLYYFISEQTGLNSDGWVYPGEAAWRTEDNRNDTLFQKFTWSFYWSFHTLTMIGITKQPETEWQFLLLTADFVLGVMLFSQVLANTMHTVLQSSHEARKFRKKIDEVVEYMDMRNVTGELRQRVLQYFEYQWINHRLVDDKEALACLPERIEADLMMAVHLETLKHVRIFQGVEPGLLVDLVLKLRLQVFAPGEYVCRKGDVGKDLYIIKKGCLEVVSDDGDFVYVRLGEGSVFGEISLLNIAGIKSGTRRTANVRSVGYSDLFALSKHDLWEALEAYPEGKGKILEIGRQILIKDNLIDLVLEADIHRRHQEFLDKMLKCTDGVNYLQTNLASLIAERAAGTYRLKQRMAKLEKEIELLDRIENQRVQMWEVEKVRRRDEKARLAEEARVKAEEERIRAEEEARQAAEQARMVAEYRKAMAEAKAAEEEMLRQAMERIRQLRVEAMEKRMKQGLFKDEKPDEEDEVLVKLFELTEQELEAELAKLKWMREFEKKDLGDVMTEGSFHEHLNYFPVETYLPPSWRKISEMKFEGNFYAEVNSDRAYEPLNFVPKEFTVPK